MRFGFLFFLVCLVPLVAKCQWKEPTQYSLGAGLNLTSFIFRSEGAETKSTPLYNFGADYFLGNHISVGPAFSFQRFSLTDTSSGVVPAQAPYITFNRISPGIRTLLWHGFQFNEEEKGTFSIYLGFRFSYEFIRFSSSNQRLPSGYSQKDYNFQRFTRQLQLGGRLKIRKRWGFFGELALGAPYLFQAGFFLE